MGLKTENPLNQLLPDNYVFFKKLGHSVFMVSQEGEKPKFVVTWVESRKPVDDAKGRSAADEFFGRIKKRRDVAKLMRRLSKS